MSAKVVRCCDKCGVKIEPRGVISLESIATINSIAGGTAGVYDLCETCTMGVEKLIRNCAEVDE
nr:MAG TPA: hypothetical protein [Caudoviricetes sp.]